MTWTYSALISTRHTKLHAIIEPVFSTSNVVLTSQLLNVALPALSTALTFVAFTSQSSLVLVWQNRNGNNDSSTSDGLSKCQHVDQLLRMALLSSDWQQQVPCYRFCMQTTKGWSLLPLLPCHRTMTRLNSILAMRWYETFHSQRHYNQAKNPISGPLNDKTIDIFVNGLMSPLPIWVLVIRSSWTKK